MSFFCCHKPNPCEKPSNCPNQIDFYAQYRVFANPPAKSFLPLVEAFRKGEEISLAGSTSIRLMPGYLYLINYLFLATPEPDSYMEIVPHINGTPRTLYAFFAPTGTERNTSAAGSFTTNEAAEEAVELSFRLDYPETVRNIDISGTISVTPLMYL